MRRRPTPIEVATALRRIPVVRHPRVLGSLAAARRRGRAASRRVAERVGSDRFSRPAVDGLHERLLEHLPEQGGVFVEAGANDGFRQSNTYYLERFRGWTGLLVEPVPELYRACVRERPRSRVVNCALVSAEYTAPTLHMHYGDLWSVAEGAELDARAWADAGVAPLGRRTYEFDVPARTLTSLLEEAGIDEIDFLSLDVEGYEGEALAGLDLPRLAPRVICVELRETDGREKFATISNLLREMYRGPVRVTASDVFFLREDRRR